MRAGRNSTEDIQPTKFTKMLQCFAGASRSVMRSAVLRSRSISIQQDVRKAKLLIQFTCADDRLNLTTGVLGQCDLVASDFGLSARGVWAGTAYIVHKFCMTDSGISDDEVLKALREKTELFAADGAYDEQLAGDEKFQIKN